MVGDRQFLKHQAATPDGRDAVIASLAPTELELHQTLAAMAKYREPNVGDAGPAIEPLNGSHQPQDLEIRKCGNGAEGQVGAPVKLQLLQRFASSGNRHEPGLPGDGDEGELAEPGAFTGDDLEAAIYHIRIEEAAVTDGRVGVDIYDNGDGAAGEQRCAGSGPRRRGEGCGDEVEIGEVREAEGEAAGVEEGPLEQGERAAKAADKAEPSLADEGGGEAKGVRDSAENAD